MSRRLVNVAGALALCLVSVPGAAQAPSVAAPVKVQLDAMPTGALVQMLMRDVMRVPYVISASVLQDNKPVSVNLVMPPADLPVHVVRFLRSLGLEVTLEGGTVYIMRPGEKGGGGALMPGASVPSGSPLQPGAVQAMQPMEDLPPVDLPPSDFVLFEPAHRSVAELAGLLEPLLPSLVIAQRGEVQPRTTDIASTLEPDVLAFGGDAETVDRALELLKALDRPRPTVELRAVILEVRKTESAQSALELLAQVGGVEVGSSVGAVPGEQFVRIATGGLRAVLSRTKGNGRFHIVAEPSLSALSGSSATINAGAQVPTVGAVSFSEDGTPVRSVVYRDSGVSLKVRPIVRPGGIELEVESERSAFARTNTGVDDSPTLNRSSAAARVVVQPGETIAFAGLDERSESNTRSGFLGGIFSGRSKSSDSSQLVLLMEASLAQAGEARSAIVQRFAGSSQVQQQQEGKEG